MLYYELRKAKKNSKHLTKNQNIRQESLCSNKNSKKTKHKATPKQYKKQNKNNKQKLKNT